MIQPIDDSWIGNGIQPKAQPLSASGIPPVPAKTSNIPSAMGDGNFLGDFAGIKKRTAKPADTSALTGGQISVTPPSSTLGSNQPANPLPSQGGAMNQAQMQNYQTDAFDIAGSNATTGYKNQGYQGLSMIDRDIINA